MAEFIMYISMGDIRMLLAEWAVFGFSVMILFGWIMND